MAAVSLPAGTVTFVFSDVEGSTELLKRLGDDYATVIADHRRIVRETFGAHGGVEIDAQGDAFFFAFARARDAAEAAVEAQRAHEAHAWPNGEHVRVRMGLHTGEPAVGDEGYPGWTSCAPPGSAPWGAEATSSSRTRHARSSDRPSRTVSRCIRWESVDSRTWTSPSVSTSS
jgi:class 3 adenylate cyclase